MQKILELLPKPPEEVSAIVIAEQLENMLKSLATNRMGTAKPIDIQDGEVWRKINADGTTTDMIWRTEDGDSEGVPHGSSFPTGTKMLFQQSAAPTGWTKLTDSKYENAALRFTTGDASSGGSVTFDNAFKNQTVYMSVSGSVGGTTLSTSQMPSHKHLDGVGWNTAWGDKTFFGYTLMQPELVGGGASGFSNYNAAANTSTEGSNYSHSHSLSGASGSASLNLDVKYVDCIVARKA